MKAKRLLGKAKNYCLCKDIQRTYQEFDRIDQDLGVKESAIYRPWVGKLDSIELFFQRYLPRMSSLYLAGDSMARTLVQGYPIEGGLEIIAAGFLGCFSLPLKEKRYLKWMSPYAEKIRKENEEKRRQLNIFEKN